MMDDTKTYTLTEEHFNTFQRYICQYLDEYGMNDWATYFRFEPLEDGDVLSECHTNQVAKHVTYILSTVWGDEEPTDDALKRVAHHEVLEHVLTDLAMCYDWHIGQQDQRRYIQEKKHAVIHRIMNREKQFKMFKVVPGGENHPQVKLANALAIAAPLQRFPADGESPNVANTPKRCDAKTFGPLSEEIPELEDLDPDAGVGFDGPAMMYVPAAKDWSDAELVEYMAKERNAQRSKYEPEDDH